MFNLVNGIFGVHEQALLARASRAELLASNLANADTPGYKARDGSNRGNVKSIVLDDGRELTGNSSRKY